jgi:hypothetical protein
MITKKLHSLFSASAMKWENEKKNDKIVGLILGFGSELLCSVKLNFLFHCFKMISSLSFFQGVCELRFSSHFPFV